MTIPFPLLKRFSGQHGAELTAVLSAAVAATASVLGLPGDSCTKPLSEFVEHGAALGVEAVKAGSNGYLTILADIVTLEAPAILAL